MGGVLGPWRFEFCHYGAAKGLTPGRPFEPAQPACLRQAGSEDELLPLCGSNSQAAPLPIRRQRQRRRWAVKLWRGGGQRL